MTQDEVDDLIDEWHESPEDIPLHEYLGWSWEEYKLFVEKCVIPERESGSSN